MSDEKVLIHYGTPRHSGRYPWGSGGDPYQRSVSFLSTINELKKGGMTEREICQHLGMTTSELRARRSIANDERRKSEIFEARKLKEKGYSNTAIGEKMGKNESSVRALLKPGLDLKANKTVATADLLKESIRQKGTIDIGMGTEYALGVSRTKLKTATMLLEEEGYRVYEIKVNQLGTGKKTTVLTLSPPGTEFMDVVKNRADIGVIGSVVRDPEGRSVLGLDPINNVSSSRVKIRYHEDGGTDKDGLIELRRGVEELSLGNSKYAQVRIGIDGTHYLKGMAMYTDTIPDGVDIIYNSNKHKGTPANKVFKPMVRKIVGYETRDGRKVPIYGAIDTDNPFGAQVIQKEYYDSKGNKKTSALNVVNEQGDWKDWSKSLSSQFLSKQRAPLIKKQLDLDYKLKKAEYDEIMSITNPTVKKKLLESYAEGLDSDAVHLKAAALPRQVNHVILPFPKMKETEVYAPNYRDGEQVVLIRHPHGGVFEIPELTVNNRYPLAKKLLGQVPDAIGINPKVAMQLSGADFDGDTVIVIPNPKKINIKTSAPLKALQNFDTKVYKDDTLPPLKNATKQAEMGKISNLITDMTIAGATTSQIARAVKHSMVVIDAEKHSLDYKQSYIDNDIAGLKKLYQGAANAGATTLVSKAKSPLRVDHRVEGKFITDPVTGKTKRVYVDPKTGEKLYEKTGQTYTNKDGKLVKRQTLSTKMYEAKDAFTLSSGTPKEAIYAAYANQLKALANTSRKEALNTPPLKYSPSAKNAYAQEVSTLSAKLNLALKNKPFERKAQLVANQIVALKKQDNPDLDPEHLKKIKGQALTEARHRVGADKVSIKITPKEWEAIQAGAVSNTKLSQILNNTPDELVKQLATPRTTRGLSSAKQSIAKAMLANGHTQADIADRLGVSVGVINDLAN